MVKPDSSGPCGVGRGLTFPGWEAYNQSLDENPVITKALTSLTGWFLGDLVTQVGGAWPRRVRYFLGNILASDGLDS